MLPVSEDTVLLGVINPQLSVLTFHLKERPTLSDNDNAPAAHPLASPLSRSFPANSSESFFTLSLSTIAVISSLLSQNQKQNNSLCHPPHFIAYSNGKPQLSIFSVYKFTAWLSEPASLSQRRPQCLSLAFPTGSSIWFHPQSEPFCASFLGCSVCLGTVCIHFPIWL